MADAVGSTQIGAEGRLAIGSGRHEVEPAPRAEDAVAESNNEIPPLIFERHRRHGNEHIIGQQRHQCIEIGGFISSDELCHDRPLLRRMGDRRRLAASG